MKDDAARLQQLPIPDAAIRDEAAVEMRKVWIAEKGLHCSLKIGMYHETTKIPETKAWGIILADAARHIADALEKGYGLNKTDSLVKIVDSFLSEIEGPTSPASGDFSKKH